MNNIWHIRGYGVVAVPNKAAPLIYGPHPNENAPVGSFGPIYQNNLGLFPSLNAASEAAQRISAQYLFGIDKTQVWYFNLSVAHHQDYWDLPVHEDGLIILSRDRGDDAAWYLWSQNRTAIAGQLLPEIPYEPLECSLARGMLAETFPRPEHNQNLADSVFWRSLTRFGEKNYGDVYIAACTIRAVYYGFAA